MANLLINDESVTIELSVAEKIEAIHGDVTVPRSAIVSARTVSNGMTQVRGLRAPGTGLPGVIMVGTWRHRDGNTFAVCHGRKPAVVLDLVGAAYNRIVLTVDNPKDAIQPLV